MDVFWTVVAGSAVFVIGQIIVKFLVEPWHNYRDCIGRIARALVLYPNSTTNEQFVSVVSVEEARQELLSLSGELLQRTYAIPFYGLAARLPRIASWYEIKRASGLLRLVAIEMDHADPQDRRNWIRDVRKALRLFDVNEPLAESASFRQRLSKRKP